MEGLPVPLEHILREVFELYEARSPEQLVSLLRRRYRQGSIGGPAARQRSLAGCNCCKISPGTAHGRAAFALLFLLLPDAASFCRSEDAVFIDPTVVAKPRREVALAFFALQ